MKPTTIFKAIPESKYQIIIGDKNYYCSIGKGGIRADKSEGDGATPAGEFAMRKIFYRADQINREDLKTELPIQALSQNDGWCDDSNCPEYNTYIKLPFLGRYEELWRQDHLYDLIVVVGYNDDPVKKDKGSAIFLHIAQEGYQPTAGCIGFKREDLLEIIPHLGPESLIKISKTGEIKFENCIKPINSPSVLVPTYYS